MTGSIQVRGEIETTIPPDLVKKHDAAEEKQEARDKLRFRVEVAGLVFVIIYAGLTAWQGCLTRHLVKISQDTYTAANRPYLGVDGIDLSQTTDPANPKLPAAKVDVHIKNFGPVPSINTVIHMSVYQNGVFVPGQVTDPIQTTDNNGRPGSIYPTETRHFILVETADDYEDIFLKHKTILDIDMEVSYDWPSGHSEECSRHRYYWINNSFLNLGPSCNQREK